MTVTTPGYRAIGRTEWILRLSALAVSALGAIGMLGWLTGIMILARFQPQHVPIAPDTAGMFLLLGFVLHGFLRLRTQGAGMLAAVSILVLCGMYGLLKLIGHVAGADLTFSSVLFPVTEVLDLIPIGRMSPITGGLFFLASLALFLLLPAWRNSRTAGIAAVCAQAVMTFGFIASVGYLYGTPLLYGGTIIPLAQNTAMGFLLLGAGTLVVAGADVPHIRMFLGPAPTARMLRTFVPLTVVVLVLHSVSETSLSSLLSSP